MFVNPGDGGKTQQQQPLQNQTNVSVRHNSPYPHTQQQPHYEHHQGQVTFFAYPYSNFPPATHANANGNAVAVSGGPAGGHVLYQTPHQPHSQSHHRQQHVGLFNAEQPLPYFKSTPLTAQQLHHTPQQHSQIRNMIATVPHQRPPYMVSPNFFSLSHALLPQQRASIITNAAPQHAVGAANATSMATHQNTTPRSVNSGGPTAFVPSPYCVPPLLLGAAPTNVTPQPPTILTAPAMGQPSSLQVYTHMSGRISAGQTPSTQLNLGGAPPTSTEHNKNAKERKHALQIIDPDTNKEVNIFENKEDSQPKPQPQSQPQLQNKTDISVESVSMQTDHDRSLTASIASDPSDIVQQTPSQSISITDTDNKIELQMDNNVDDTYDIGKEISDLDIETTTLPSIPNANTTTHTVHSGSEESVKNCVCEDPYDTDADTNEQELDNEDDVIDVTDTNLSITCIDQQSPTDMRNEQETEENENTDLVTLQTNNDSDTDHSTEAEVKSKEVEEEEEEEEPRSISVHNSIDKNIEDPKEIHQKFQNPPFVVCESKRTQKMRKNAKRKEKNQKKLKQQQKNKSNNMSTQQNKENNITTTHLKETGSTNNKALDTKNKEICQPRKEEKKATIIRYSLEQLKTCASLPDSCKTPVVPCQKGDCISQLFVARQQHHLYISHSHQVGQHITSMNLQSYQHMNFNESIDLINNKRRAGGIGGSISRNNQDHHSNSLGTAVSGGAGGGGGGGSSTEIQNKMQVIHINLSLNEEIKLSECKNAWQPKLLSNNPYTTESGKCNNDNIEDLLKKVRGILNKLTSENFDVLLKEMTSININTPEKMQKIMLLIFEKTVSEPNFAPTYAKFSKVLFEEAKAETKDAFNSLLIKKLEKEFELNVNNADAKERKLQEINNKLKNTKDQQEKIELKAELEHQEYQFRRRAWGTVRFIGEMYKLYSLSASRVFIYVESLLKHGNEEKLEYMCKLLTTVGNLLESTDNNARMNKIFTKIQTIVKEAKDPNKKTKICSRVRFMMQDLIDLRSNNWGQSSYQNSNNIVARKRLLDDKNSNIPSSGSLNTYERGSSHRMSYGNNNRHSQTRSKETGASGNSGNYFMQKSAKSQYANQREQQSIDLKKLNFSRGDDSSQENITLGDGSIYMWRVVPVRQTNQSNGIQQSDRNSSTSSNHYSQKHQPQQLQNQYSGGKNINSSTDIKAILESCPSKDNQKFLNHLMEEYLDCILSRSNSWQEEVLNTWQKANNKQQICLIYYILMDYLHLAAIESLERNACANIFIYLMNSNAFNKSIFTRAYEHFAEEFPDLLMDVPNGWTYIFQFLGPLLHERLITFNDIWHTSWRSNVQLTERFVNALIFYFTREFGANYIRDLWHKVFKLDRGQVFKSDQQQWQQFIATNNLQFIYDCKSKPNFAPTPTKANSNNSAIMDKHVQRLATLLSSPNDSNLALDYINTNVYINSYTLKNLTRFLCCDYATTTKTTTLSGALRKNSVPTSKNSSTCSNTNSNSNTKNSNITNAQLNITAFRNNCIPLLRLCIDAHEDNELTCLDSVVDAIQQDYDDNTANELICGIFDNFYDCELIPKESFEKWYKQRQQNQIKQPLSSHLQSYIQKLI